MSKARRNKKKINSNIPKGKMTPEYQISSQTEPENVQVRSFADTYEINRENTLVSQAGLITAVFSFSTTALFSVWQVGLNELEAIPDMAIHIAMGCITLLLLLSLYYAVSALYRIIDTSKISLNDITVIKNNNNIMVRKIRVSIRLFHCALFCVLGVAVAFGICFYCI